jgi:hypothetical protein
MILIQVDSGESGLIVTADLSGLDSTQPVPVRLTEISGGLYKIHLDLNFNSTVGNGTKKILVKAIRVNGRVAETSVEVELNNPPVQLDQVPLDDDFSGNSLNPQKWGYFTEFGGEISQDGQLVAVTSDAEPFSRAMIQSTWRFIGDFDVQVEFAAGPGWGPPATEHLDEAVLGTVIDEHFYHITRLSEITGDGNDQSFMAWNDFNATSFDMVTSATAGRYRLVRHGTTLFFLYDIGSNWKLLGKMTVPESTARIYMGNMSVGASTAFTTFFDNFHVTSGITSH